MGVVNVCVCGGGGGVMVGLGGGVQAVCSGGGMSASQREGWGKWLGVRL